MLRSFSFRRTRPVIKVHAAHTLNVPANLVHVVFKVTSSPHEDKSEAYTDLALHLGRVRAYLRYYSSLAAERDMHPQDENAQNAHEKPRREPLQPLHQPQPQQVRRVAFEDEFAGPDAIHESAVLHGKAASWIATNERAPVVCVAHLVNSVAVEHFDATREDGTTRTLHMATSLIVATCRNFAALPQVIHGLDTDNVAVVQYVWHLDTPTLAAAEEKACMRAMDCASKKAQSLMQPWYDVRRSRLAPIRVSHRADEQVQTGEGRPLALPKEPSTVVVVPAHDDPFHWMQAQMVAVSVNIKVEFAARL